MVHQLTDPIWECDRARSGLLRAALDKGQRQAMGDLGVDKWLRLHRRVERAQHLCSVYPDLASDGVSVPGGAMGGGWDAKSQAPNWSFPLG